MCVVSHICFTVIEPTFVGNKHRSVQGKEDYWNDEDAYIDDKTVERVDLQVLEEFDVGVVWVDKYEDAHDVEYDANARDYNFD